MSLEHCKAEHIAPPFAPSKLLSFKKLPNCDEIAHGFRHLLAFELQKPVVYPEARHQRSLERRTRLRDLVLVMWKNQVDAVAMDVENLAEMLPRHRRALDVPAWATALLNPSRRGPSWFTACGRLPQHEIHWVALVR